MKLLLNHGIVHAIFRGSDEVAVRTAASSDNLSISNKLDIVMIRLDEIQDHYRYHYGGHYNNMTVMTILITQE